MPVALTIREDVSSKELRRLARREKRRRPAMRMLAIANALDGMSRALAAKAAGIDYQALRDAVVRYNAEGVAGLYDRAKPGRPERLDPDEKRALSELILAGPDPEADGISSFTLSDLCRIVEERHAKPFHPASMSRVVRRMGFSRQKARPRHPRHDPAAQAAFKKGGSRRR
jgi:transposase